MDILIINKRAPFEGHGAERVVWQTAKGLAANGHEVTFFCPTPTDAKQIPTLDGINFKFVSTNSHDTWGQIEFFIRGPKRYRDVYRSVNPDLVVDNPSPFPFHMAHLYGDATVVNKVYAIYRGDAFACKQNPVVKLGTIFGEETYRAYRNETFITISKSTTERLQNLVSVSNNQIYTNPIGIDASGYKYRFNENSKQVMSLSKLSPRKSISTLLKAWGNVEEAHPDANLVIAGKGPQESELKQIQERLNLDSVEFAGYVNEQRKHDLLEESRVFVLPTLLEGFGLVNLEAMATGCAVVSTDTWGVKDYLRDGQNGVAVPPHDHERLADAIDQLLSDAELARSIAENGRATAEEYSIEQSIDREISLLESIVPECSVESAEGDRMAPL